MNSYLNFNPTPTPYSYKKSRYKKPKPIPKPAPPPRFDVTTFAMGEEGGGGFCNPKPFPFPFNPEPRLTTLADGEEGGGGYNPPHATTRSVGEEGGGGYNPPRPEPFRRPEPPALISIDLSVAQKVHKTADGLDGNMNNIADTKQLRQLRQDLETIALPNLKSKLNPALSPAEQKELQGLIKSTEKEIEAIDFMINNAPTLAGEPFTVERRGLDGKILPRVIKFDALQETANKVSEDPNRVLLTDKDVTKPRVF